MQDLLRRLPRQVQGTNEFRDGFLEYEEVTSGWTALMYAASQVCSPRPQLANSRTEPRFLVDRMWSHRGMHEGHGVLCRAMRSVCIC